MIISDIGPRTVTKIFDHLRVGAPRTVERLRVDLRVSHPGLSERAVRARVVSEFLGGEPRAYRMLRKQLDVSRPETRMSSPLEQIKGLTSLFSWGGELMGGNSSHQEWRRGAGVLRCGPGIGRYSSEVRLLVLVRNEWDTQPS
jgi:hypothetical protein